MSDKLGYFEWLLDLIGVDFGLTNYKCLYDKLSRTSFQITHPRDNNRRIDGADLRWKYHMETGKDVPEGEDDACSVLEMLIAFAIRIDNEWSGTPGVPEPEVVFWSMICNLGLKKYNDRSWNEEKVDDILWKFMRKSDEKCMIFPVFEDLNREFWDQAVHYLHQKRR